LADFGPLQACFQSRYS